MKKISVILVVLLAIAIIAGCDSSVPPVGVGEEISKPASDGQEVSVEGSDDTLEISDDAEISDLPEDEENADPSKDEVSAEESTPDDPDADASAEESEPSDNSSEVSAEQEDKVEGETRPQYLMQKDHQTHEKDVPRNHMAYEDSEVTPIYVYVMNIGIMYDYAGNTMFGISQGDVGGRIGENYGAIKQAGLKVWICDINGNKIDYVYTNSSGMAKFEAYEGEYTFYFEGNDTFYARFASSPKHSGVVKCDETYDLAYRDSDLAPGAIVRRVMTYEWKLQNYQVRKWQNC